MEISPGSAGKYTACDAWTYTQQNMSKWFMVKENVARATDEVAGPPPHLPF